MSGVKIAYRRVLNNNFLYTPLFEDSLLSFQAFCRDRSTRELLDFCGSAESLKLYPQRNKIIPENDPLTLHFSYSFSILDGYLQDGPVCAFPGKSACTYQYYNNESKYLYSLSLNRAEYDKKWRSFFYLGNKNEDQRVFDKGETFHPRLKQLKRGEKNSSEILTCSLSEFKIRDDFSFFKTTHLTEEQAKVAGWILDVQNLLAGATLLSIEGKILSSPTDKWAQKIIINHQEAAERFCKNIEENF